MNWQDFQIFEAVMASKRFGTAADRLDKAVATVRRSVGRLEDQIGSALFIHGADGLVPTVAAKALIPGVRRMSGGVSAIERLIATTPGFVSGPVAVFVDPRLGAMGLGPIWRALLRDHPGLVLEFGDLESPDDVSSGRCDVGVLVGDVATAAQRGVSPTSGPLDWRAAGSLSVGLYGHPCLWAPRRQPMAELEVSSYPIVAPGDLSQLQWISDQTGAGIADLRIAVMSDVLAVRIRAIQSGQGIGAMPVHLGDSDTGLVRVLPNVTQSVDVWVATSPDRAGVTGIDTVRDTLVDRVARLSASRSACGSPGEK